MNESEKISFVCLIAELPAEKQNLFFDSIKGIVTEKEREALQIAAAYFGMMLDPYKNAAIKEAMAQQLYKEFNGAA